MESHHRIFRLEGRIDSQRKRIDDGLKDGGLDYDRFSCWNDDPPLPAQMGCRAG